MNVGKANISKVICLFDLTDQLLNRLPAFLNVELKHWHLTEMLSADRSRYRDLLRGIGWESVSAVVIFGHRMPDMLLCIAAQRRGVPVYYVQHGLFKERLERNKRTVWSLVRKKAYYYLHSFFCARRGAQDVVNLRLFVLLVRSAFWSNRNLAEALSHCRAFIEVAYVFDDRQKIEYRKIFGDGLRNIITMGNVDAGRIAAETPNKKSAIILCQSLVEDGRLSASAYKANLVAAIDTLEQDGWAVSLFLHQRSDIKLYNERGLEEKVILNSWSVPSCELYLTDYSSLILEPFYKGRYVSRLDISGHVPMNEVSFIPTYPDRTRRGEGELYENPFEFVSEHLKNHIDSGWEKGASTLDKGS